jgi:hypothetical protein
VSGINSDNKMAKTKSISSSPPSLSIGTSAKKMLQSDESTIKAGNNTPNKETRQEDKSSANELFPSDVFEQREEGGGEDVSFLSEDCHCLDIDIDQLYNEFIDRHVKKWQAIFADAMKVNQEKRDATTMRNEDYEKALKRWQELFPSDVFEQREGRGEDVSFLSEDCNRLDIDIDQLSKELELQESVIKAKEQELMKWRLVLETQRENIDKHVRKWQAVLADATKVNQEEYEEGIKKWQKELAYTTTMRNEKNDKALEQWQNSFASPTKQLKEVEEAWQMLEASRHTPTKEMEQASERLKQLEELANVPTKAMMEAKKMIEQLEQQRDYAPTKGDSKLTITKKEKTYVKDVMKWQNALADATAKLKKDCKKWKETFLDSQHSKEEMKQVSSMVPTKDMEQSMKKLEKVMEKLEQLERQEKHAHMIVMRHARMTVYKLEKELLSFKSDLNTTKKLIRQAEDSIDDFSDGWEGLVDDFVDESTLYSAWPIQIPILDPRGEDMCLGFSCGGSAVLYDAGGSTYCRSW